jgi:hypothetical protein
MTAAISGLWTIKNSGEILQKVGVLPGEKKKTEKMIEDPMKIKTGNSNKGWALSR